MDYENRLIHAYTAGLITAEEVIIHAGEKGMRWGFTKNKRNGGRIAQTIKSLATSKNLNSAADALDSSRKVANVVSKKNKEIQNQAILKRKREDLSNKTDAELREAINRYDLETKYHQRFSKPTNVEKATRYIDSFLDKATTASELTSNVVRTSAMLVDMFGKAK